jgi:prolyl-tRNA synthetase
MKYRDLKIQTQREAPNNARTEGFSHLVRAGYMTRESMLTPLGEQAVKRLQALSNDPAFISLLSLQTIGAEGEIYFPIATGNMQVMHCAACGSTARKEVAKFKKVPFSQEAPIPMEKVHTPDCNTIESLAKLLKIPKEKNAKALMYTRISDEQFVFIAIRGDMTLSETKLNSALEGLRLATPQEIANAGAVAGYASPVGLKDVLIVVDDLIPQSPNLVAGANEAGYHLLNTNCGRDFKPEFFADLTLANQNDACLNCGEPLSESSAYQLVINRDNDFQSILFSLAEAHHDEKGLTFPKSVGPFDVYLMHVTGKEMDTRAKAEEIYRSLEDAGISVLFDDRDERAGVKFNDADLIGCPLRVTIGEKALKEGMVELKPRKEKDNKLVQMQNLIEEIKKSK